MIVSKPIINQNDYLLVKQIASDNRILEETASILFNRGIDTLEKAKRFLNPSKDNFFSPFGLSGVAEAVERLDFAKKTADEKPPEISSAWIKSCTILLHLYSHTLRVSSQNQRWR